MTVERHTPARTKRRAAVTVLLVALSIALVTSILFNAFGLFFMDFGDELCQERPAGEFLSDPGTWRCVLRLEGVALGVALFGLYSLPYGLTVAWVACRLKPAGLVSSHPSTLDARWAMSLSVFLLTSGIAGGVFLFVVTPVLFGAFGLLVIPILALVSLGMAILILIDYSRNRVTATR